MSQTIHIIGAGVSGLIAAIELEKNGYSCVLFEQSNQIGGRVQSDLLDGYSFDHGFQVLLTEYPAAKKWLDYKALDLQKFRPGAEIVSENKTSILGDPRRDLTFIRNIFDGSVASIPDKIKTLKLAYALKRKSLKSIFSEESISSLDYLKGKGFSDQLIIQFFRPFWGGIFLETDLSTSSRMLKFIYKMFGAGYSAIPSAGMQAIPNQLFQRLRNTTLLLNHTVTSVEKNQLIFKNGKTVHFEHLIIATDLENLLRNHQKIEWKSCYNYYFEIKIERTPTRMISLVSNPSFYVNNYHYTTDLVDHPQGKTILSATVVNSRNKSEPALLEEVIQELKVLTKAQAIKLIKAYPIKKALPQVSDIKYSPTKDQIKLSNNIYLAGDQLSMGSLNAAILSGEKSAQMVIERINNA
ncbi:MAG: protoporphyrinogen oxidase [Saprospiraceae bacterium]